MLPHFLKRYLYLNDYKTLCVALRTLADTSDTTGQSLTKLHKSLRFALETEPQSNSSDANFQQLVPISAFLLDHKHLTCPLPWLENGTALPIPLCLEILSDLLILPHEINDGARPLIKLASASFFLRFETDSDLPNVLSVISDLLRWHSPFLKTISITVCSQTPLPLNRARALEAASETALPFEDQSINAVAHIARQDYLPLKLDNMTFPKLESLQLALPFSSTDLKIPALNSLHLSYLNDDIISIWSRNVNNDGIYIKNQAESIQKIIRACTMTLKNLTISGAVRLRSENRLFDAPLYLPSLISVNLGWTTAAELDSLYQALLPSTGKPLKEILSYPKSVHSALIRAESISEVAISYSGQLSVTNLPPRLPAVRHVIFNGPLRIGLTDRHLSIYAKVIPRSCQEELLLQYGILNLTIEGIFEFRKALEDYCHCTIFRHPSSLLHKILVRRSFKVSELSTSGNTAGGLDFPTRHSKSKLKDLFLYEHITPSVQTQWRKNSRYEASGKIAGVEIWPEKGDGIYPPPPVVGEKMTGRDLFALEFWQIPQLIRQQENQLEDVYELWDQGLVDDELKRLYDEKLLQKYINERRIHFPFERNLPWWDSRLVRNLK